MQQPVLDLFSARNGHFLLESGHHGDSWLDLETLCLRPRLLQPFIGQLAPRIKAMRIDAICGPLVEGAFVGLLVAEQLNVDFTYSEQFSRSTPDGLFPVGYRMPKPLRTRLRDKRVAIVNDVINAGSAVKGTLADLRDCGASVVAIATLLVLGTAAMKLAAEENVALETLATQPNNLWTPAECPLCAASVPLEG